jgi:hypothetical protein
MTRRSVIWHDSHWFAALVCLLAAPLNAFDLTLADRFRPICPADLNSIRRFESSLVADAINGVSSDHVWVAVYRSFNNKPSVLVKDEFIRAMNAATSNVLNASAHSASSFPDPKIEGSNLSPMGVASSSPVAVARLRPVNADGGDSYFVLDSIRCVLEKENMDSTCDGGSEHTEALATAIDTLIQHYLDNLLAGSSKDPRFDGIIRTKATIFSAPLLEERGFRPVTELQKEMITHVSSLDDCLERYAMRSISTSNRGPGAQRRAVDIVSKLGCIDRAVDLARAEKVLEKKRNDDDNYNPWASRFF